MLLLSKEQKDEVCDARDDDSSTVAGKIKAPLKLNGVKFFYKQIHYFIFVFSGSGSLVY
jgi:hypothetical protein